MKRRVTKQSPGKVGDRFGAENAPRDDVVTLRVQNIIEKLSAIIEAIQRAGGQVGEVHLRANTLEDVFIALTGRRLRQ